MERIDWLYNASAQRRLLVYPAKSQGEPQLMLELSAPSYAYKTDFSFTILQKKAKKICNIDLSKRLSWSASLYVCLGPVWWWRHPRSTYDREHRFWEWKHGQSRGSLSRIPGVLCHKVQVSKHTCEPGHKKMCLMSYANNKGADQPAHPRSLISAFIVRCLDSIISLDSIAKISRL